MTEDLIVPPTTTTERTTTMLLAEIVVVTCNCGNLPLNTHRTAADAWKFAADHVALNPTKCSPGMFKDTVPAALAPTV